MFSAMLVGLVAAQLFVTFTKKGWVIKMPEQVPPAVSKAFAAVVPGGLTLVIFGIIAEIFAQAVKTPFVDFNGEATYCQIDGQNEKAILVGEYPRLTNEKKEKSSTIVDEPCETTEKFVSVTGEVDAKRSISGTIQPNDGGSSWCIQAADYGSGDDWHGPALRYNLSENVTNFECSMYFYHDSTGKLEYNESGSTSLTEKTKYKVTSTTVKLKEKRLSSSKTLISIKKGIYLTADEIVNGWIKTTYSSQTGWIKISTGLKKVTVTTANYYTKQSVSLRATGSKKSKLLATIPKGTCIVVYPKSKEGKYTKATYKGQTGYVYTDYIIESEYTNEKNRISSG